MKPSRSRYLQSLAFEEGEYEQSQASFDIILARFSLFIEGKLLSGRSTPIRDLLFRYANARDIKNRAATDVYAIAVTAGLECQLGRRVMKSPAAVREIRAHLIGKLGNVYGVPASTLNEMLTDSWAGTDCIARPLSMFGL